MIYFAKLLFTFLLSPRERPETVQVDVAEIDKIYAEILVARRSHRPRRHLYGKAFQLRTAALRQELGR
jgi:hypothetical protein